MSADIFDPFSAENLAILFREDPANPNCVTAHENFDVEFKENFHNHDKALNDYARVIASLANNKGGYLIFGIDDKTLDLLGMTNQELIDIKPEAFTSALVRRLYSEIKWKHYIHSIDEKTYGVIYIYESSAKPIYSKMTDGKFSEGAIYYRYGAKTENIRYPELHTIIEQRQAAYQQKWIDLIQNVAKFGVENAAILNLIDGESSGPNGKFIVPKELLDKINFIREGQFTETGGDPTLRVIGDAETVDTNVVIEKKPVPQNIDLESIIHAFLDQTEVSSPEEYLKAMCSQSSSFSPPYYFMKLAKLTTTDTISMWEGVQIRNTQTRKRLINRLNDDSSGNKGSKGLAGSKKDQFYQSILGKTLTSTITATDIVSALQAIQTLDKIEIDVGYLFPILKTWFDSYYFQKPSGIADSFGRTICYIDYLLFKL